MKLPLDVLLNFSVLCHRQIAVFFFHLVAYVSFIRPVEVRRVSVTIFFHLLKEVELLNLLYFLFVCIIYIHPMFNFLLLKTNLMSCTML